MEIGKRVQEVVSRYSSIESWELRYKEIIQGGKKLEGLTPEFQIEKYKIKGCQSQVWLVPSLENGKVLFKADSDAVLVKGIIALLLDVYSDSTPDEILATGAEFLKEIGITEHLSMNRSNGLASMVKQIQMYAIAYKSLVDKGVLSAPGF